MSIDDELIDRQLREWGASARSHAPHVDLDDLVVVGSVTRSRWATRIAIAAAVALVLAVIAGAALLRPHDRRNGQVTPITRPIDTATRPAADLVIHDGDVVQGDGEVLAIPHTPVRLCADRVLAGTGGEPDPASRYCPIGVDVTGADLGRLSDRKTSEGTVYGLASLVGVYRHGALRVTAQGPYPARSDLYDDRPPCRPPAGGWPRGSRLQNVNMRPVADYRHAHPGTVVEGAALRPSATQVVVYVLTVGDPAPVRAALAATYGPRLCVARSIHSPAQVARARRLIDDHFNGAGLTAVTGSGTMLTRDGQLYVDAEVALVSESLAAQADTFPVGLIRFDPLLEPAR